MNCVSLNGLEYSEILKILRKYPFIELRLDKLELSTKQISQVIEKAKKSIITLRGTEIEKVSLFKDAIDSEASYIDLDYIEDAEIIPELKHYCKNSKSTKLILSYHYYDTGPGTELYQYHLNNMKKIGAEIYKIAAVVESKQESMALLQLLIDNNNLVLTGMGSYGPASRISALLHGSLWTYSSLSEETATASGQIVAEKLESIIQLFQKDNLL